jgi:hypothetical protein
MQMMQQEMAKKDEAITKGFVQAATTMGMSPTPITAASAMTLILDALMDGRIVSPPQSPEAPAAPAANDPSIPPQTDPGSVGAPPPL